MNIELDPDNKTLIHLMTTLNREKGRESHGREYFDASDFARIIYSIYSTL